MARLLHDEGMMPPLIRFVLKWSLIGMGAGWCFVALLLLADTGGLRSLMLRSEHPFIALLILGLSFSVSFGQVTVLAAVLLRSDFGGTGHSGNDRLERWKAGESAELDPDQPED